MKIDDFLYRECEYHERQFTPSFHERHYSYENWKIYKSASRINSWSITVGEGWKYMFDDITFELAPIYETLRSPKSLPLDQYILMLQTVRALEKIRDM
jgi:hypothetical protein